MTTRDPARQRILRHRHKRERQAVIFGGLIAGLAVSAFLAAAIYSGTITPPFARGFSSDAPKVAIDSPVPCPPKDTKPLAYKDVQVNVLNATKTSGLAGATATNLTARGFTVLGTGNYPTAVPDSARIMFGANGLVAAYTVAAQFDKPSLVLDARTDATVDIAVGDLFTSLLAPDKVTVSPDAPLQAYAGCVPIASITPAPAPTANTNAGGDGANTPATPAG
jgi:LytR cell envelope-related transcriptional attenuator